MSVPLIVQTRQPGDGVLKIASDTPARALAANPRSSAVFHNLSAAFLSVGKSSAVDFANAEATIPPFSVWESSEIWDGEWWVVFETGTTSARYSVREPAAINPNAPLAIGHGAANIQLRANNELIGVRFVVPKTGTLQFFRFAHKMKTPGYGAGDWGVSECTICPCLPDGTPDFVNYLAREQWLPGARAPDDVDSEHDGWTYMDMSTAHDKPGAVLGAPRLPVTEGAVLAAIGRNLHVDAPNNNFSWNFLQEKTNALATTQPLHGLQGAQSRNEMNPAARDVYYGLPPQAIVVASGDGGATWWLPGTPRAGGLSERYLPVYGLEIS